MGGESFPRPESYRERWSWWANDPNAHRQGVTFDRTPAASIAAPRGLVRLCAWHLDFDEHPTCWMDVGSVEEARYVVEHFAQACAWNVDYCTAYDDKGRQVAGRS